ncbi:MAG: nuclease-related domain-containing protein [Rhodocyclaceae bacterium]|nr:nuclease-related domain-containing protein [Rhodocyclaceae bacterium]
MFIVASLLVLSAVFALAAMWAAWRKKACGSLAIVGAGYQGARPRLGPGKSIQPRDPLQILELSNHAADKADAARSIRLAGYSQSLGHYQRAISDREQAIQGWQRAKSVALSRREWLVAFKSWRQLRAAKNAPVPQAPLSSLPGREETLWAAGQEGERRLDAFLASRLDSNWTLLAGYKNAKGEVDRILVGPEGVFAFEVKNLNGVIHCDGDHWWRDKRDRYGNLVERGVPIADKGGRGPSRQINEAADTLERFLGKRAARAPKVTRVVVFTHDRAVLGAMENVSVNIVATLTGLDMDRMFAQGGERLEDGLRRQIVALIRRDHEFNADMPRTRRQMALAKRSFLPLS